MLFKTKKIAIDLGTVNTVVYQSGRGIILNEPSVVAISSHSGQVLAVGTDAREMLGRTGEDIIALKPLKDGVVADYEVTEAMLRYFFQKALGTKRIGRVEVLICTPAGATSIERRALIEATLGAGAKAAFILEESLAAAIGANIPIGSNEGNMVVDLGGGTTEIAVISLGGIVTHHTERLGGNHLDDAIIGFLRRKYNLVISERRAEEVKHHLADALRPASESSMEVKGRDAVEGLPKTITVTADDIHEAIMPILNQMIDAAKRVLEKTPPELASDIIDRGIVLTGGGALLPHLDNLLSMKTSLPVHKADDPLTCVVRGAAKVIDQFAAFKGHLKRG
jgi:rod shape-determining protein MreB